MNKCNSREEYAKNDEFLKNKVFPDTWHHSEKLEFNDTNIDDLLDIQPNQLSSRVERWTYEGSDCNIDSILQHQIVISEIAP